MRLALAAVEVRPLQALEAVFPASDSTRVRVRTTTFGVASMRWIR